MPETAYLFPGCRVTFDGAGVCTWFPGGRTSPVATNADHAFHAARVRALGGACPWAGEYNLGHELGHHLVGVHVFGRPSSRVVYASAHGLPQEDPGRELEEWYVTALQYLAAGADPDDHGALIDVAKKASPARLARVLNFLLEAARLGVPQVTVPVPEGDRA